MKLLDYYIEQQKYPSWVLKFQSTSGKQSGKTFSYVNTNYRHLLSFLTQLQLFENNNGRERSEWKTMKGSGQEKDKHRVANLINIGFLKFETGCYLFTNKGYTAKDLVDAKLSKNEKWILTFLLSLDFHNEERDIDIIRTYYEIIDYLKLSKISFDYIIENISKSWNIDQIEDLFNEDIFWYITFVKDKRFLDIFKESTIEEKTELKNYVSSQNKLKNSKDCIGHKFVTGGAYSLGMFKNDLKMLYFVHYSEIYKELDFEEYVDKIILEYCKWFIACDKEKIKKFILGHKSVYKKIYEEMKENGL